MTVSSAEVYFLFFNLKLIVKISALYRCPCPEISTWKQTKLSEKM